MPIVVVERGNDKGRSIKVEPGKKYVFGRDPNASVTLSDPLTSRRHFEIAPDGKSYLVRDMDSTNGTFLNDDKLDAEGKALKVGDKIQVGETILSFLSDQREETAQGLVGKTIGGYKILERVGRGGMGTVYKSNQLSLNRIVAFKVLSARLLKDEKFIEKFKSEARAAGALNHPNIVGVYDVGTDRNIHFFSMEFMDGGSVQDLVGKDGKLTWEETLDVLIQASKALIFAEKKGIVHRDVKPDNLMLTSDGQTKLADLGLAKKLDGSGGAAAEEGIFGTPHFISPEQAQGKDIDHRADLYSLGATAYRLLAGRTPFQGTNVTEIVQAQITKEPDPLRKLCPDAPEELIGVVAKCMMKSPAERYESAEALHDDLEQIRLKYHLKVHGGSGGKGVLAAVALALVAVVAVIVFAVTRDNGSNGNGGQTAVPPQNTQGPRTITVIEPTDPEEIQRQKEMQAELAFLKVQNREKDVPGLLRESALTQRRSWEELATEYDRVAGEHPGTKDGRRAATRAKEIREEIARQEQEREEQLEAATSRWLDLKEQVNGALEEGRFAEALRLAEAAKEQEDAKQALRIVPGAAEEHAAWLSTAPDSIRARFSKAWTSVRQEVETLRDAGDVAAAAGRLREFFEKAAGDEYRDPFGPVWEEAKSLLEDMLVTFGQGQLAALDHDRRLYYRTWLTSRHHEDAKTAFADNVFFEFRFEEAAKRFDALLAETGTDDTLGTSLFRDRAGASARRLRMCAALHGKLIRAINERDLLNEDLDLPPSLRRGANSIAFDWEGGSPADAQGFSVIQNFGRGMTGKIKIAWADFSASEYWLHLLKEGGRFEMTSEDHAQVAVYLALAGVLPGLDREIAAAGTALSEADRAWLAGEFDALEAWAAINLARTNRPPNERILLGNRFVQEHCGSDFFILVYGYPEPWQRLHSEETLQAWMEMDRKPVREVTGWIEKRIEEIKPK